MAQLDDNFQLSNPCMIDLVGDNWATTQEDPRLICWKDQLWVFFVRSQAHDYARTQVWQAVVDIEGRCKATAQCPFNKITSNEKNWVPFIIKDHLCMVYSHHPSFVVLIWKDSIWQVLRSFNSTTIFQGWKYGSIAISGGCPPIWKDNKFYSFFHSSYRFDGYKRYAVGCCTFDEKFNILQVTQDPIMIGPTHGIACVFPCGVIYKNGKWILSYGYQDEECRIAVINEKEIEDLLVVPKSQRVKML